MILNSDFYLYNPLWERADKELCSKDGVGLFGRLIDVFLIACAIGIKEDKRCPDEDGASLCKTIGRNTYTSLKNTDLQDGIDFMLQNALINSDTINYDMDERLRLAFDPDYSDKKLSGTLMLVEFANYGIEKIFSAVDNAPALAVIDDINMYLDKMCDFDFDLLLSQLTLEDI